jgi:DNA mismatch repair protein MutS2
MGKASCLSLVPISDPDSLRNELLAVSEYLASFDNDNRIPNHGFEDLSPAFQLLKIENSVLEVSAFRNIATASHTVNTLLLFLKKFKNPTTPL